MTDRAIAAELRPLHFLGVPIERHESIGSTNDEVFRRAAEGAPEGLVVVAGTQTAGRGRMGRSWWDSPGASLSFSILLRPKIPLPQYPLLALAVACAVAEAGTEISGEPLDVKWPNDVVHRGRKLCGVLAESRVSGGVPSPSVSSHSGPSAGPLPPGPPVVIGAGVNVNQRESDFPPELRERATSLRIVGGEGEEIHAAQVVRATHTIALDTLLAAILHRLERYVGLAGEGDPSRLWNQVTQRLPRPGTAISVQSGGRRIDGTVEGITETGALRLRERGRDDVTIVSAGEMA